MSMTGRARQLALWYDAVVPAVVFALAAIAFAAMGWQVAAGAAIGALAGYSLSGSV